MNSSTVAPVFLHAACRTGSTYVWSRFRQNPDCYCYFEPMLEGLAWARPTESLDSRRLTASMHHPELDRGYLAEYPLAESGGVEFYQERFAMRDWFLETDANAPELRQYFEYLLELGAKQGKRTVFKLCRSSGRIGWFVRNFPGIHAYILREPRDQWTSCKNSGSMWRDNIGRFMAEVDITRYSEDVLRTVNRRANDRVLSPGDRVRYYTVCMELLGDERQYFVHYYLWLVGLLNALRDCQFIIDMGLMSANAEFRASAERFFASHGVEVNFDDCQVKRYHKYRMQPGRMDAIENTVHDVLVKNGLYDFGALRVPGSISARYTDILDKLQAGR